MKQISYFPGRSASYSVVVVAAAVDVAAASPGLEHEQLGWHVAESTRALVERCHEPRLWHSVPVPWCTVVEYAVGTETANRTVASIEPPFLA